MGTGVSPKRIATRNTIWPFYRTNNLHLVLRASCPTSNPLRFFSVDSSLHMSHSCFKWFSKQVCFLILQSWVALSPWWLNNRQQPLLISLERRWSSRTFRYGYLVTTSPQLSVPPSAAPSWKVGSLTSGVTNSHGVTGGVYKTRERIHRDILIRDY